MGPTLTSGIQTSPVDGQNLRIAGLLAVFVGSMSYSLFLAGATHNLPSIWTANAVLIAAMLILPGRARWVMVGLAALLDGGSRDRVLRHHARRLEELAESMDDFVL